MGQGGRTRCSHGTSPPWSCHSRRTAVSWAFVWPVTCERSAQPLQYVMCTVHRAHHGAHVHRRRGRTTGARRHAPLSRAAMLALRHLHRACRRPQSAFPPRPSGLRTLTSVVERQRRSDDGGGWKPHEQRGMHRMRLTSCVSKPLRRYPGHRPRHLHAPTAGAYEASARTSKCG